MNFENIFVPDALRAFFKEHARIALAFSGGCDSAYLLYAAAACGTELGIYHVHSCFQPEFELQDARMLAEEYGQKLHVLNVDILADARVRANPENRCYHCKKRIFEAILNAARADGFECIMDGTNASDEASDRPGMRALQEMQVLSPLRLCGITKAQVRALSREAGIFTWNKPAYACLATRIPANVSIDSAVLNKVEKGEAALEKLGFSGMRLRISEKGVRLELPESQMMLLMEKRAQVVSALEDDFGEITLDLKPRKELEI